MTWGAGVWGMQGGGTMAVAVVTYEGLFAFCLVIIGVISICITIFNNRKK